MEFLDSLDLDPIHEKSHRVRSWYLYEQFKSLEKSQSEAAQKLKDRSYQEKILRQELSERRARRKLYDQFGLCQSEPGLKRVKSDILKASVSTSDDDFMENFFVLHDDERVTHVTGENQFTVDTLIQDGLTAAKCCMENFVSVEDHKEDNCSYTGSVASVVENIKSLNDEFLPPIEMEFKQDFIDKDIDIKNSLSQDIKKQFDSVQENIQCFEEMANLEDVDKISEKNGFDNAPVRELQHIADCKKPDQECNMIAIWSRLVSFAYQLVQLNHGNCYCDYSSQFLTAVLACDVLRRGVNRMCHILQPYVSPIEFARDDSDFSNANPSLNVKRKKSVQLRKCRKICEIKPLSCQKPKKLTKTRSRRWERKHSSRNCSEHFSQFPYKQCFANGSERRRHRRASEPWHRSTDVYHYREEISSKSTTSSSVWSDMWKAKPKTSRHSYRYHNKALHPLLKIGNYIDSILKDIEDCKHDNM